jgi:hypothetical protein
MMMIIIIAIDRLCGIVVRVPGYKSRGPGLMPLRYQIFWEIVDMERGPLSLVSKIEELLGRNSSGSGLESREYDHTDPSHWQRGTLYSQRLALTSPTSGCRAVGIIRSRTQATVFYYYYYYYYYYCNTTIVIRKSLCCVCNWPCSRWLGTYVTKNWTELNYGSTVLCWALAAFSVSWSRTQSVGLLGWRISPSQGLYLHTGQHKHKVIQTSPRQCLRVRR